MIRLNSTAIWVLLLLLTLASFSIGELNRLQLGTVALIGLITLAKGWMVADFFMGLQRCGGLARWLVAGWLLLVLGLIAIAYRMTA